MTPSNTRRRTHSSSFSSNKATPASPMNDSAVESSADIGRSKFGTFRRPQFAQRFHAPFFDLGILPEPVAVLDDKNRDSSGDRIHSILLLLSIKAGRRAIRLGAVSGEQTQAARRLK